MAIIDSLLQLVTVRGADALVLPPGQVPFLERDGESTKLTMPVPGNDVVGAILREVASAADRETLDGGGRVSTAYRCPDATVFAVEIQRSDGGYHMAFRRSDKEPAPPALEAPVRREPSGSTPYRASSPSGPLAEVLDHAHAMDASDVVISADAPPRVRIGGQIRVLDMPSRSSDEIMAFIKPALAERDERELADHGSCDIAFASAGRRYRVNLFRQHGGLAAAFRPITREVPTLAKLNLPDDFNQLTTYRSGLVLMVGTAGSGKSTTLVALIEHLNRTAAKHIITLEDPIEYTYRPKEALIHQREVGRHVSSFAVGLRAALRESPDVILLGEMRDHDTIAAALTAAETGHLVLSTLHSGSADMAIHRIVDVFPEHEQEQVRHQIADVLRAIVTQHLCVSTRPPQRVPAYERLIVNAAVATKIRENRCHQIETELQRGRAEGMVPLELSLAQLVKRGVLAMRTAHELAADALLLEQLVRSA